MKTYTHAEREQKEIDPEIAAFRARFRALRAWRDRLWGSNRHAIHARRRKNDSFVGGSEAGRRRTLEARGLPVPEELVEGPRKPQKTPLIATRTKGRRGRPTVLEDES